VSTASAKIVRFEEFVSVCWAFNATPPEEGSSFGIRARPQKGENNEDIFLHYYPLSKTVDGEFGTPNMFVTLRFELDY
jgi:hypothetical protein